MAPKAPKNTATHLRPWIASYPEGIVWDAELDTRPVHEQVLAACARNPSATALDFLGGTTSFGDLAKKIIAFAGALQRQFGVKKGSRVALMLPNTPFYPIAYYAVLRAGGTVVNCNPLYTVHELSHITESAGADVMVTLDLQQIFEKAEKLVQAGHVKSLVVCHFPDALPLVKKVLFSVVKRKDLAKLKSSPIADRISHFHTMVERGEPPTPVVIDAHNDIAVQQYTGGTTGLPKGAQLTHANIAANMSQIDKWGCGLFYPPSKVVAVLPFFHIFAMTVCMNVPLCNGTQVVMLPRFELKALLNLFERTRANVLPAVPTLLSAIARADSATAEKLASLEVAISGGAALPNEVRSAFARKSKAVLAEGYGLTEASPVVCCAALRVASKPMSIGMPLPGTDIRFVNLESNQPVGIGEDGELQVKGAQVMLAYHNEPEATEQAFMDGWLRTGDVGHMDDEGYVFLVDRIKDLIICSGFNVYPRTIEEALMNHEAVEETNVIGVPDEYRGEAPIAYVKLRDGKAVTEAQLKNFISDRVSKIEMPREIIFKDALPKTLIGKLSKKELREEYQQSKASS
ncbi:long-chain fatty acid--CoA ligase [Devosia neptuniae]|jgi:long-chain acyl-CoA synthetase|uniref:long-chain-fatty-acid--CoA ligase n=1 Tax=Devosia TaxID=46913 RepID=UPI0022B00CC2|nr:long-chain fatty acid--CoA ligase [Devosia neptuniae]MCZ4346540.1 long-chain fatty acid--CoA ligase [Devosia neptuniae]|tara:strand:+ start:10942 stop:12660 length:1719 start_codon:yes stop_codon:yes gene_type:complete